MLKQPDQSITRFDQIGNFPFDSATPGRDDLVCLGELCFDIIPRVDLVPPDWVGIKICTDRGDREYCRCSNNLVQHALYHGPSLELDELLAVDALDPNRATSRCERARRHEYTSE